MSGPQSRYVGYYEIMKTKFDRQLPPPKSLRIKSIRIHSIAGKTPETSRMLRYVTSSFKFLFLIVLTSALFAPHPGVGKGDGSDLKVKIIVKKELVFQCVCAKQENCTVRLTHSQHMTLVR